MDDYYTYIENQISLSDNNKILSLSVVIVTLDNAHELNSCLESIKKQTIENLEVVLVNNGKNLDLSKKKLSNFKYIKLKKNYGVSIARNIGALSSAGEIIAFLDDDALANSRWAENIIKSFKEHPILAVRGKCLPKKSGNIYNRLATHYDLGPKVIPSYIDLEGNSAFLKKEFNTVGGFNKKIFGHEGMDLTKRLVDSKYNLSIYDPDIIIRHDFCDSFTHFVKKSIRHNFNFASLNDASNNLNELTEYYDKYRKTKTYNTNIVQSVKLYSLIKLNNTIHLLSKCTRGFSKVKNLN